MPSLRLSSPLTLLREERDRWFLWLPVGIAAGIAVFFMLRDDPPPALLLATPILGLLAFLARRREGLLVLFAVLLAPALGFNAAQVQVGRLATPVLERPMTKPGPITGRLMMAEPRPGGTRLTLAGARFGAITAPEGFQGLVRVTSRVALADLPPPGALIELRGQLAPFSEPVIPGGYDFRRHAWFLGYGATGWSFGEVMALPEESPSIGWTDRIALFFETLRRDLALRALAALDGDAATMTAALLNGQQGGISADSMRALRLSGLVHLLSISGVHVGMVGALVYVTLRALLALVPWIALRWPLRKIAAFAAILATIAYTFLVGTQAPTLRSSLMVSVLMLAVLVDRRALSLRVLALSASAVLLVAPDSAMGASFQMSFAAVLAMIATFEKELDAALREHPPARLGGWIGLAARYVGATVATSFVATAATAPFTLYHFQSVSFYGVVANMIAVPLTSFWIMPCLLLTYLTAPFGLEAVFIQGAGAGSALILDLARKVAAWPSAQITLPAMPDSAFLAIIGGGLWLGLWRRGWRWLGLGPVLIGLLYPLVVRPPDFLVSPSGLQWAVRAPDGRLVIADSRRERFTVTQWQQRLGHPALVPAKAFTARLDVAPANPFLLCDPGGCIWRAGGQRVALPATRDAALEDLALADLVIAPFALTPVEGQKAAVQDSRSLRVTGAFSLSVAPDGSLVQRSVLVPAATRPWSVPTARYAAALQAPSSSSRPSAPVEGSASE